MRSLFVFGASFATEIPAAPGDRNTMKISDLFPVKIVQANGRPEAGKPDKSATGLGKIDLAVGQLLKGRVTGLTPQGKILLDIKGQTVTAQSHLPLKVGSEIWLEVKQTGAEPWFVLADSKGAVHEFLQLLLPDSSLLGKAVQSLFSLAAEAKSIMPPEAYADFEALLQGFAESVITGDADPARIIKLLLWLKGGKDIFPDRLGVQIADFLVTARKAGGQRFLDKTSFSGLEKFAGITEAFNNLNSRPIQPNQALFLLFPCFFAAGAGSGEWMFALDEDAGTERHQTPSHFTLMFFLEMSRLGDIHLRLTIKEKVLQGEFVAANEAVQAHLEAQLPELQGLMEKLGYNPVHFGCRVADDNLMRILKQELEKKAQLSSLNILDVTA